MRSYTADYALDIYGQAKAAASTSPRLQGGITRLDRLNDRLNAAQAALDFAARAYQSAEASFICEAAEELGIERP